MSRRLKVSTREMGDLELFLIYEVDGVWEEEWRPLQGLTSVVDLMTAVPQETMDHCLKGLSKPLVKALGLPPWGVLKKLPSEAKVCHLRDTCVFYDQKTCFPESKNLPWCYEPDISADADVRRLLNDLVQLWRDEVYVILVRETTE